MNLAITFLTENGDYIISNNNPCITPTPTPLFV
jgi:hypothetical protein